MTQVIESATLSVFKAPVLDGIAMSFSTLNERTLMLVELFANDGKVGAGESWVNFPSWAPVERVATIAQGALPLLAGKDPSRVPELQSAMRSSLASLGNQWGAPGPISQAISAVDIALWDLLGKSKAASVGSLLGPITRKSIPVYASSLGPKDVEKQIKLCARAGHTAVKLKVGFGQSIDELNLATAREMLDPTVRIYVDANQAWTLREAVSASKMFHQFGVDLVEEPIRGDALLELTQLYEQTGLNIATGENLYGLESFQQYIESPAIRVIQPDICKTGGLTEVREIVRYAAAKNKNVMPHVYSGAVAFAAALQLAASAPAVVAVEYDVRHNPLRDEIQINPASPQLGQIDIPSAPGLGIQLDRQVMSKYLVNAQSMQIR